MTRSIKFCIISILTFVAIIFCALGFDYSKRNTVYAQSENQVVNYFDIETTSLRISDQGMRWVAKMDVQTYENITTKQNVSFHFIIAPTVLMNAADGQYMQMPNKIQIDVTDFGKAYEDNGFWCINGAVNNLNPKNITLPYSAVAVIATDIDGVVTYEYTKNLTSHSAYDLVNNAVVSGLLEDEQVSKLLDTYSFLGTENYPIKILLAHRPDMASEAKNYGLDLQISGHTHGGSILLFDLIVATFNDGFVSGLYKFKDSSMQLYVSNGSSIWSAFPFRIGVPNEITLIRLKR